MTDNTQKKELALLFGIIVIFGALLSGLYVYEQKSRVLEKQGHNIFNSFISK